MTPFDEPFDFEPGAGAPGAGSEPAAVPARPLCRVRGTGARTRTRYRGEPPR